MMAARNPVFLTPDQEAWLAMNTPHYLWEDCGRIFNRRFGTAHHWQDLRAAWWTRNMNAGARVGYVAPAQVTMSSTTPAGPAPANGSTRVIVTGTGMSAGTSVAGGVTAATAMGTMMSTAGMTTATTGTTMMGMGYGGYPEVGYSAGGYAVGGYPAGGYSAGVSTAGVSTTAGARTGRRRAGL